MTTRQHKCCIGTCDAIAEIEARNDDEALRGLFMAGWGVANVNYVARHIFPECSKRYKKYRKEPFRFGFVGMRAKEAA